MPIDFEAYSTAHPQLHAADAYPKSLLPALTGRSGTFLDVGAGLGSTLHALLRTDYLRNFTSIIATDIASRAVETMRREMPTVQAVQADALSLPLPNDSVDLYFSNQVIEHVPSDSAMIAEAYRVLKPGGVAFIGSVLKGPRAWYYYRSQGSWTIDPTHLREYRSVDAYRRIFTSAGFHCDDITVEPIGFPLHKIILVILVRLRLIKSETALQASKHPFFQALGRVHLRVPGYSYIYAVANKLS